VIDVAEVSAIIRRVAEREVLPRFGALVAADISEKSPGDLVTVADRAAEDALAERLGALLPGSVVVGEEAVAADPGLLALLDGPDPVWIVDPIDGTKNFVDGSPRFTMLVALARKGELLASWTHAPALDVHATATKGGGARVDGRRVRVRPCGSGLRALDIVTSQPHWWTPEARAQTHALARRRVSLAYFDTSGLEYVELAAGRRSAMILGWEFPWDHAAGILLHAEAGGVSLTADGTPFRLSGGNSLPFVSAPDEATALAVHEAMRTVPELGSRAGSRGGPV
jgi:fructose-1,6-bisphosphatase/inositol monophosphatase family enzyme